jgi:hypothetical protein
MATTLGNLIDDCEADLLDSGNTTWAAADIEQWCRDAIADYSLHFPRQRTATITTVDGDRKYAIGTDLIEVINVEYPISQDPPQFLRRKSMYDPDFYDSDDHYDVIQQDDDASGASLYLSAESTVADQSIYVTYLATHDNTIATGGNLTVPVAHHHILRNYVLWRATLQRKAAEEASPTSSSSLLMSQLAVNADRARRSYTDVLAKALYAWQRAGPVSWKDAADESTRIY